MGVLLWCLCTSSVLAEGSAAPRVAIVSDANCEDLAALVTSELSSGTAVTVVERDNLAKIGDEAKLQQFASDDAVALGKLAGANGLLFLDHRADGVHARFTAVNLGYALFDDPVPSAVDSQQEAKALAHLVANDAPKLKLDPAKAIPLSILNLHADYGTAQSLLVERNLTLLLESRLTSIPEYVVLERRHAWSLNFEHSLDPAAKPFLRGAYLIDGTVSFPAPASDDCRVALRIRAPNGAESTTAFQGTVQNLSGLADQIRKGIQTIVGGTVPAVSSSSEAEATEYLREALWGWRSRAPEAAVEAADSAELLGGNEADVLPLRARSLGQLAEGGMEDWLPFWHGAEKSPPFDAAELSRRTDEMLRALDDAARYETEKLEPKRDLLRSAGLSEDYKFTSRYVDAEVVYVASKILVLLDETKSPRADELRQALRPVSGYDPFQGKKGKDLPTNINNGISRTLFADNWAASLDEELAYYRLVLTDTEATPPQGVIFDPTENFGVRFLPTPEARQQAFDNLVESLRTQPQSRLIYLALKTHAVNPATADTAYRSLLDQLWSWRDELVQSKAFTPHLESFYAIKPEVAARNTAYGLPLLHYLFNAKKPRGFTQLLVRMLWHPDNFQLEEVPGLWKEFLGYRKKIDDDAWANDGHSDFSFDYEMEQLAAPLIQKYPAICISPAIQVTSPVTETLAVTKYWHPWTLPGTPDSEFIIQSNEISADGIWLGGSFSHGALYHVNLTDFTAQRVPTPDNKTPMELKCIGNHVYMTYFPDADPKHRYLARYDTQTGVWESRLLPDLAWLKPYEANGSLYFFVTVKGPWDETALVRYDWDHANWIELANNRRRPARNQFDDTAPIIGQIGGIFTGPRHRPCVCLWGGTYYIREDAGEWPRVFDDDSFSQVITIGDRSLVFGNGEVTLLKGAADGPQYWVANATPHVRRPPLPGKPPVQEPTPWLAQARWQVSASDEKGRWRYPTAFHGDNLYLLSYSHESNCLELICYLPGEAKPRHVPLSFHLDNATRAALASKNIRLFEWTPDKLEHPEEMSTQSHTSMFYHLVGTEQGVCFVYNTNGFWFLPYSDIDAYLQSHPSIQDRATPPITTTANAPKESQSSTKGDADYKVGNPTSLH